MTGTMSTPGHAPPAVVLAKKAAGKFTPILYQWLAFKSAVAVVVCAAFAAYYGGQLGAAVEVERNLARIGAGAAVIGFVASVVSVWSLWGRKRMPALPFAVLSAASSPALIAYWVWTAFLAGS